MWSCRPVALALAIVLVASSCGSSDEDQAATTTTPAAATAATAAPAATTAAPAATTAAPVESSDDSRYGGIYVIPMGGDPETLSASLNFGPTSIPGCKIQEGLVRLLKGGVGVEPELAESWDISTDGMTYTFYLRQGVKWHDGEDFTSEDVKFTFDSLLPIHPASRRWLKYLESVETPDDHTVVLTLNAPFAPVMRMLNCSVAAIAPAHIIVDGVEMRDQVQLNQAPVGTGPFVFKEWIPGDRIVVERNEDYWRGRPYLDEIVMVMVSDASTMTLALQSGEIDYISGLHLNQEDLPQLMADPNIDAFIPALVPATHWLSVNHGSEPLDRVEVRRALYMAFDRQFVNDSFYAPLGASVPKNMIPDSLPVALLDDLDLTEMYPYDPAAANALLDEIGLERDSDGIRFELDILWETGRGSWSEIAETVRANWADIGVKVNLDPVERVVMLERGFQQRDYDIMLQTYTTLGDPSLGVARIYLCEPDSEAANFGNPTRFCDENVDDLFDQAAKATAFEDRQAIFNELQVILAAEITMFPFSNVTTMAVSNRLWDLSTPHTISEGHVGWEDVYKLP